MVRRSIAVRRARESDAELIAELSALAFSEFSSHPQRHTLAMARAGTTLVAELGGRFAGFAVVEFEGRSAHLSAIAVREADRGLGVGARLLQAVEALGRKRGARTLELCTADSNLAALDLFLKRGFRIEKRLSRFYARGQTACQLAKALA